MECSCLITAKGDTFYVKIGDDTIKFKRGMIGYDILCRAVPDIQTAHKIYAKGDWENEPYGDTGD